MNLPDGKSVILFDGVCNLCNGFVQFIIVRDKKALFVFASLQSKAAEEISLQFQVPILKMESVILIEDGKVFQKSTAGLKIISRLPYWGWAKILLVFPKVIRDFVYDLISRNRYKIFGSREACMIPTPELRVRFLGDEVSSST